MRPVGRTRATRPFLQIAFAVAPAGGLIDRYRPNGFRRVTTKCNTYSGVAMGELYDRLSVACAVSPQTASRPKATKALI